MCQEAGDLEVCRSGSGVLGQMRLRSNEGFRRRCLVHPGLLQIQTVSVCSSGWCFIMFVPFTSIMGQLADVGLKPIQSKAFEELHSF